MTSIAVQAHLVGDDRRWRPDRARLPFYCSCREAFATAAELYAHLWPRKART